MGQAMVKRWSQSTPHKASASAAATTTHPHNITSQRHHQVTNKQASNIERKRVCHQTDDAFILLGKMIIVMHQRLSCYIPSVSLALLAQGRNSIKAFTISASNQCRSSLSVNSTREWGLMQMMAPFQVTRGAAYFSRRSPGISDMHRKGKPISLPYKPSLLLKPTTQAALSTALSAFNPLHVLQSKLPLVQASDDWGKWAALTDIATVSQNLGETTKVGRLL
jgi:hypothetical protein